MTAVSAGAERDRPVRLQPETRRDRPGADPAGDWVVRWTGRRGGRGQEGSGKAAQAGQGEVELASPGPVLGQMQDEAACLAGSSPAREKQCLRRALVVASCFPRPTRVVQRAKLWAITCMASQAALAGKRPEGRRLSPTPHFRSRMAFSISAWQRWSASRPRVSRPGR